MRETIWCAARGSPRRPPTMAADKKGAAKAGAAAAPRRSTRIADDQKTKAEEMHADALAKVCTAHALRARLATMFELVVGVQGSLLSDDALLWGSVCRRGARHAPQRNFAGKVLDLRFWGARLRAQSRHSRPRAHWASGGNEIKL